MMRAVVYEEYGPPEVLHLQEVAKPVPKGHEILIRVHAVEVTKSDCELRSFRFPVKWYWLMLRLGLGVSRPRRKILGVYFAGEVAATGGEVTRFSAGQRVFGATRLRMGAYAEYVCLPESYTIARMPGNLGFAAAAAVPLGGLNALHYMRKAEVREGEKVLVNGAGGSIGIFAVQIAKAMGAEVTAVDCAAKENMLRSIGADHFIDYRREPFTGAGCKYDVIFSVVAGAPYAECVRSLEPGGRYLMANPYFAEMLRSALTTRLTDRKVLFAFAGERLEELTTLREMAEAGEIRPVVDRRYPLGRAAEAHRRVEAEQRVGSVVLDVGSQGASEYAGTKTEL